MKWFLGTLLLFHLSNIPAVPILNNEDFSKKKITLTHSASTNDHASSFTKAKNVLWTEFSRLVNASDESSFSQPYANHSEYEYPYFDEDLEEEHINFR